MFLSIALSARAQPRIRVLEGNTYDWGRMAPGTLKAKLHVMNVGTDTLDISEVQTTCGCTTAPIDRSKLVRGDTALLDVSIDMRSRFGDQVKEVILVSNDRREPSLTIDFHALIVRDLIVQPTHFPSIVGMKVGKESRTSVQIMNTGTDTIQLDNPRLVAAGIRGRFTVEPSSLLPPGGHATLTAYLTPVSGGYAVGYVAIPSSSRLAPEIQVQLVGQVADESVSAPVAEP
jgi:hypothetical protein